jgi:hypothetical protein
MDGSKDLQDLKQKLQIKRRQQPVPEEKPAEAAPADAKAVGAGSRPAQAPQKRPEDDFVLVSHEGAGPRMNEAEWASESKLIAAEKGSAHGGKKPVMAIAVFILVLVFAGIAMVLGEMLKEREFANARIDEAHQLQKYFKEKKVADKSKTVVQSLEDFKVEVDTFVGEIDKALQDGKTPLQLKDRILAFLEKCTAYVDGQSVFPPSEVFGSEMLNSDAVSALMPVVINVEEVFALATEAARLHDRIKALQAPKADAKVAVLVGEGLEKFEPPVAEGQPKGDAVDLKRPKLELVDASPILENPAWKDANPAARAKMERFYFEYRTSGAKDVKYAKVADLGSLEFGTLLQKRDEAYVNGLIAESFGMARQLKALLGNVKFNKVNELLDRYTSKEKLFTF